MSYNKMLISVGKRDDKMKTATELRDLLARIDRRRVSGL